MKEKKHSSREPGNSDGGDKALWDLLGRARRDEASAMFSRNVLREIRQSGETSPRWGWVVELFRKPSFSIAAACVLILFGLIVFQSVWESPAVAVQAPAPESVEYIDPELEFKSIEMLGELMAVSDPGMLSDEALMNLLF